jgi:ABC-type uncharacterized transport system auxiliary subunit
MKYLRTFVCLFAICATLAFVLSSCISLKTEYPRTAYYRLEQKPVTSATVRLPQSLLIKPFTIDSEFDTDRIMTLVNGTETQALNYHRWITEPQELITAHVRARFAERGAFAGGVFTPESSVAPALVLEGRIVECLARSATAVPPNTVTLRIHCTLQQSDGSGTTNVLLQKIYSHTAARANDAGASIAPAMSDAASAVSDSLLNDITLALTKK